MNGQFPCAAAPTGGMATQGVARFGTKALDRVLEQAKSPDSELASGAIFVTLEMLGLRTVSDPASHLRIKKALWSAASSADPEIRDSAMYAVKYLNDSDREEFVPMLKQLAERDPAKFSGPHGDGSVKDVYYVRRHARVLLEMIDSVDPNSKASGAAAPKRLPDQKPIYLLQDGGVPFGSFQPSFSH